MTSTTYQKILDCILDAGISQDPKEGVYFKADGAVITILRADPPATMMFISYTDTNIEMCLRRKGNHVNHYKIADKHHLKYFKRHLLQDVDIRHYLKLNQLAQADVACKSGTHDQ